MENRNANNVDTTQASVNSVQPSAQPSAQPPTASNAQLKNFGHYLAAAFGILFLLVIFVPNSTFAQYLAVPIVLLGAVSGIKFFIDSIVASRASNPFLKTFIILGGLGVGVVIFFVCLFAGAAVSVSKDPHPQHS